MSDFACFNSENMEKDKRLWNLIILKGYSPKKFRGILQDKVIKLKTEGTFPGGQTKLDSIIKENYLETAINLDGDFLSIEKQTLNDEFLKHGIQLMDIKENEVKMNYFGNMKDFNTALWDCLSGLIKIINCN